MNTSPDTAASDQAERSLSLFLDFLVKQANTKRISAAFDGSRDDGGCAALLSEVAAYRAGAEGKIPAIWESHRRAFNRQFDPEYQQYLELKNRFGE